MPMKNKIDSLIKRLGVSAYRFAEDTGITKNTVYSLKNNPSQFPSGEVFDRIISTYKVSVNEIIEWVEKDGNDD
jgi:DNA-binding Xre family transcriptional regulator